MMSFVHVCVCRSEVSFGCYSSGAVHVIFQGRVMTGTPDLPVKPGWLVNPQGAASTSPALALQAQTSTLCVLCGYWESNSGGKRFIN